MFRALLSRSTLINRKVRWIGVRGLSEVPSAMKKRMMDDFRLYLDGRRSQQTVFYIMKMCATGLRAEMPRSRISLADHVYTSMKDKGLPLTVQMYNSLLQVYLSNRHPFSPSEVLTNMREEGIIPNRGTLTLLLQGYCQQGNMTGAKEILSELKHRDMTINEEVYGALISGHAQDGDMESAQGIIDIMRRSGLNPGLTAYSALLSGHAFHADIDAIKMTIESMKEKRVFVTHNVFADMIDAMSMGGHHDKIPEILEMIRNKEWMYNELLHKAEDLAARGEGESSIHILSCLAQLSLVGEGQERLARTQSTTLRNMALSDKPLEYLVSCVDSFSSAEGSSPQPLFDDLIRVLFSNERWGQGRALLLEMHKRGLVVKPYYFYPPLADSVKRKDLKGLFQWLDDILNHFQFAPDSMIVDYTAKALKAGGRDIAQYLKEEGVELTERIMKLMVDVLCRQHQYEKLYRTLQSVDKSLVPAAYVLEAIAFHTNNKCPSMEALSDLFTMLGPSCDQRSLSSAVHKTVMGISRSAPGTNALVFVKHLLNTEVFTDFSSSTCNMVLVTLNKKEYIEEFFEFLRIMKSQDIPVDNHHRRQILKLCAKTGSAYAAQVAFRKMKEDGVVDSSIHSNYIIALCRGKKHYLALKHYQEIEDNPEYQLAFVAYSYLIQGFIYRADIDSAIKIRRKITDLGLTPGIFVSNTFLEGYASIGDTENAQKEFDMMVENDVLPNVFSYQKLMQCYAHQKDVFNLQRVLREAEEAGIVISKEMVSLLVETSLACKDLEGALSYLEKYSSAKPTMKTFIDFVNAAIREEKGDLTTRAMEILKEMEVSKDTILHIKMFSLLRCGRQEEAIDIARKEQLRVNLDLVNEFGMACQSSGNVECLQSVMKLLRELGMQPYMLHIPLIKAYAFNNDTDALLNITKELESLGETPKAAFHFTLAQLLKQQGKESPGSSAANVLTENNVASV